MRYKHASHLLILSYNEDKLSYLETIDSDENICKILNVIHIVLFIS